MEEESNKKLNVGKCKNGLEIRYFFKNDVLFPIVSISDYENLEEFINPRIEDNHSKAIMYVWIHVTSTWHLLANQIMLMVDMILHIC